MDLDCNVEKSGPRSRFRRRRFSKPAICRNRAFDAIPKVLTDLLMRPSVPVTRQKTSYDKEGISLVYWLSLSHCSLYRNVDAEPIVEATFGVKKPPHFWCQFIIASISDLPFLVRAESLIAARNAR